MPECACIVTREAQESQEVLPAGHKFLSSKNKNIFLFLKFKNVEIFCYVQFLASAQIASLQLVPTHGRRNQKDECTYRPLFKTRMGWYAHSFPTHRQ